MLSPTVRLTTDAERSLARLTARRRSRFAARSWLWRRSKVARVRSCGRGVRPDSDVTVKVSTHDDGTRRAGFGGVQTCGSVWVCPVCSANVASHRQGEIAQALTAWHKLGGRVALLTLTMRHRDGQRLATLWDALSYAWGKSVTAGRAWKHDQALAGTMLSRTVKAGSRAGQLVTDWRVPIIRVVEVTHGANGWHVHVHALLLLGGHVSDNHVQALGASMFGRWSAALVRKGLKAPSQAHGVDVRLLAGDGADALSDYFTKAVYSASMETARGDLKDSRFGNRTPFAVLHDLVAGEAVDDDGVVPDSALEQLRKGTATDEDAGIWGEWERASKGRRQITWSHGLREMLAMNAELTDEQVAELERDGEIEATIDRDTWSRIVFADAQLAVLIAFEVSTVEGHRLLRSYARGRPRYPRSVVA